MAKNIYTHTHIPSSVGGHTSVLFSCFCKLWYWGPCILVGGPLVAELLCQGTSRSSHAEKWQCTWSWVMSLRPHQCLEFSMWKKQIKASVLDFKWYPMWLAFVFSWLNNFETFFFWQILAIGAFCSSKCLLVWSWLIFCQVTCFCCCCCSVATLKNSGYLFLLILYVANNFSCSILLFF